MMCLPPFDLRPLAVENVKRFSLDISAQLSTRLTALGTNR
jgi:hypothetical protein